MPWQEVCTVDIREEFVALALSEDYEMVSLCADFGISRKTGYKWLERYRSGGRLGLVNRSRAAYHHPHAVAAGVEARIVELRARYPHWGARKLKARLERLAPQQRWPAASTIGSLLQRHGLVVPRRHRRRGEPYSQPFVGCGGPNAVWCADFKGWFRTADAVRCDPFTLSDAYSRYLLRCQAVRRTDEASVWPVFVAAFREYGMPEALRTDNGPPFGSIGLGGLSHLAVKLLRLGIVPERIAPAHPEQNGRHERLHRTLKAETTRPPAANRRQQQQAFDQFRRRYNEERPHEALGQQTPAQHYQCSPRPYPLRLPQPQYPDSYLLRRIHHRGFLRFAGWEVYLSEALAGEWVGLEQQDDKHYAIYFAARRLATLDGHRGKLI
jgi:putative transposase